MDRNKFLNKKLFFLDFETNKKEDFFIVGLEIDNIYTCYVVEKDSLSVDFELCEQKVVIRDFTINNKSCDCND